MQTRGFECHFTLSFAHENPKRRLRYTRSLFETREKDRLYGISADLPTFYAGKVRPLLS